MATNKIKYSDLPITIQEYYPLDHNVSLVYRVDSLYGDMFLVIFENGQQHIWDKPPMFEAKGLILKVGLYRLRGTDRFRNDSINAP